MKRLLRRLIIIALIAAAGTAFYSYGQKNLWPAVENSTISTVGIIEAQEVNITSRIAGRIAELNLIEGDSVKRGQHPFGGSLLDGMRGVAGGGLEDLGNEAVRVSREEVIQARGLFFQMFELS